MNDDKILGFWFIILVIALAFFAYRSDKLNKQVNAYQEQSSVYEQCISDYQTHEHELTKAITDASDSLDTGGQWEYRNAQDTLSSVDKTETSCNIPTVTP